MNRNFKSVDDLRKRVRFVLIFLKNTHARQGSGSEGEITMLPSAAGGRTRSILAVPSEEARVASSSAGTSAARGRQSPT